MRVRSSVSRRVADDRDLRQVDKTSVAMLPYSVLYFYQATVQHLQFADIFNVSIVSRWSTRSRTLLDYLRGMNNFIANGHQKSQDQHKLLEGQDIRGDWTSWEMSRLAEYAIHTNIEDWAVVVELCNKLGIDPQETEESFKVLINDIRFSTLPSVQLSAAKLWMIMIYRCRPYFASHIPEQELLGVIEEVALSSRTSPVVRDRLVEVMGASVFLLKDAEPSHHRRRPHHFHQLSHHSLRLIKPPSNELPATMSLRNWVLSAPNRAPHRSPATETEPGPAASNPMGDARWLFEECESARGNCRILAESLLYTTLDSVLKDPLIKKTMTSKEIIDAHIETATISADSARARRWSNDSSNSATRSTEEQLLQALVTTQAEIKYTLQSYDELAELANSSSPVDAEDPPISRQMSGADVVSRLIDHGCKDLSDSVDHSSFGEYPFSTGGFSDVYDGRMLDGTKVALKLLRVSAHSLGQDSKHLKHAARELHTWSKCTTRTWLLLGLLVFRGRIGMISPWMGKGVYLTSCENTGCVQICEGLSYLHEIGIVHGDMKGPNVLIADDGTAVLSDFGNAFLKDRTMKFTPTTSASGMSIRWSAPEIINGERPSKASDVYALGTTIYVSSAISFTAIYC
ncbi:GAT domain [Rhizoctonia solani]|uniref:GAT domain n=1 Tax=Rhizoctonia solani TaxID=456999 RepID=A0A8H7M5G2_9AGAM|nr:GAT domain [Rhizoctonia solani]